MKSQPITDKEIEKLGEIALRIFLIFCMTVIGLGFFLIGSLAWSYFHHAH